MFVSKVFSLFTVVLVMLVLNEMTMVSINHVKVGFTVVVGEIHEESDCMQECTPDDFLIPPASSCIITEQRVVL